MTTRDYRNLASFRQALRRFLHFSEAAARRAGIPPQQHQALLAIRGRDRLPPLSVGELAERLQLRHHSAVGLIDRLAEQGLVRRVRGRRDRRWVLVDLTPKGEKRLATLAAAHREELRRVGPELVTLLRRLSRGSGAAVAAAAQRQAASR